MRPSSPYSPLRPFGPAVWRWGPQAGCLGPDIRRYQMCRPPVCRVPMCPGPPICRVSLAVRVSGPAGSLPCREEWFGCSGIRNSKFQRRHPASRNPACQQFGIPNSIIGLTGACALEAIRGVPGEDGAQPDRVAPPRPWNGPSASAHTRGRLARKGVLPAYLAAFPRGRCPAMRRPEARPGAGIGVRCAAGRSNPTSGPASSRPLSGPALRAEPGVRRQRCGRSPRGASPTGNFAASRS